MRPKWGQNASLYLGIEGGGTRTVALLADGSGRLLNRMETGPSNLKLLGEYRLEEQLREISAQMPVPDALAIGLAGTWSEQDSRKIQAIASRVWKAVPCHATNDLETALAAAGPNVNGAGRVLVVSGTGSCCYAHDPQGRAIKVGSGGHMLADNGSAFQLSLAALRGTFATFEEDGRWPALGGTLLRALQFNEPDDFIGWANTAGKSEISSLAVPVLRAWRNGDKIATKAVKDSAGSLAREAAICARRSGYGRGRVEFILSGSMLLRQPHYAALVKKLLRKLRPGCQVFSLERESAWGAIELARRLEKNGRKTLAGSEAPAAADAPGTGEGASLPRTEQRNPRSMNLDKLPLKAAIQLMLSEEETVPRALLKHDNKIEEVIRKIAKSLKAGGKLFYVGAGTSGRLGVLDASECPPTFRTTPDLVQGIIAGGQTALWNSIEGAEDNYFGGGLAVRYRGIGRTDIVIGITASGTTPFVWGALDQARKTGAATVLVCFNPDLKIAPGFEPDVVIAADVGAEVLTGSTRLKAGTATKLLLNTFSTLAMVRLGKVVSNLMSSLNPSNAKLRKRAIRIVCDVTGCAPSRAREALEQSHWDIPAALQVARKRKRH